MFPPDMTETLRTTINVIWSESSHLLRVWVVPCSHIGQQVVYFKIPYIFSAFTQIPRYYFKLGI